jgi:hypothetical protein
MTWYADHDLDEGVGRLEVEGKSRESDTGPWPVLSKLSLPFVIIFMSYGRNIMFSHLCFF